MSAAAPIVLGDWGTTRLRLYLVAGDVILDRCAGPGIGALPGTPGEVLLECLTRWKGEHPQLGRVVLCGMAGSRNGLSEVPYCETPLRFEDWQRRRGTLRLASFDIAIAAGLCRVDANGVPDVMRGEETQLFGALDIAPQLGAGCHRVVLPGTHSKWVELRDGVIVGFTTYMTGELFALLRQHSTLLRAGDDASGAPLGFAAGLERSAQRADELAAAMFEARAAQLIQGRSQGWATEFLSGLLIGAEARAALRGLPRGADVHVIGDPKLAALYGRALTHQGMRAHALDGDACSVAGLTMLAGRHDAHRPP